MPTFEPIGMLWGSDEAGRLVSLTLLRVGSGYGLVGSPGRYLTSEDDGGRVLAAANDWFELRHSWITLARGDDVLT